MKNLTIFFLLLFDLRRSDTLLLRPILPSLCGLVRTAKALKIFRLVLISHTSSQILQSICRQGLVMGGLVRFCIVEQTVVYALWILGIRFVNEWLSTLRWILCSFNSAVNVRQLVFPNLF